MLIILLFSTNLKQPNYPPQEANRPQQGNGPESYPPLGGYQQYSRKGSYPLQQSGYPPQHFGYDQQPPNYSLYNSGYPKIKLPESSHE